MMKSPPAILLGLLGALAGCDDAVSPASDPPVSEQSSVAEISVEEEVVQNILQQQAGLAPFAAQNYPEPFVRRVADRIIRESYRAYAHAVYADAAALERGIDPALVQHAAQPRAVDGAVRPQRVGFRADDGIGPHLPADATPGEQTAAEHVAANLANDGLLRTTRDVIAILRRSGTLTNGTVDADQLRRVGVPVDLLRWFSFGAAEEATVERALARLAAGDINATFQRPASLHTFRATPESGQAAISAVHLQATRGTYWGAPGDGGCLDLIRQMAAAAPDAPCVISVQDTYAPELRSLVASWSGKNVHLMTQTMPVAQWAADNGKAGAITDAQGRARPALLMPRYASRREDGSVFVPGEDMAARKLAAAGVRIVPSALLFQGGNILIAQHPVTGRRLALIGEAEIYRNLALGLTEAQVKTIFRHELDVDEVLVFITPSFHIDLDVSVRAHGDQLFAFVNDEPAASSLIVHEAVAALKDHITIEADDGSNLARLLHPLLRQVRRETHGYPLSLANLFTEHGGGNPVGNLHRVITAIDLAVSAQGGRIQEPGRHARAYAASLSRRAALRDAFHAALSEAGFAVVPVPGLAEADRSLMTVNAVQHPGMVLMPAYGGFLAPVDEAAAEVYRRTLGPETDILPILTAESQRRAGGVHCSVCLFAAELDLDRENTGLD